MDVSDIVTQVLTNALQGVGGSSDGKDDESSSNGKGAGLKGIAAGAAMAALAPIALRKLGDKVEVGGLRDVVKSPGEALGGAASKAGDRLTSGAKDKAKEKIGDAINPGEMLKDAAKNLLPGFGGGDDDDDEDGGGGKQDTDGVGKGRRMPVQQSVDIALPLETVYNQWTQFEDWPKFMHRVTRASQDGPCRVSFAVKIWGKTKEFVAEIQTQRPDDRIKWKTSEGMTHTGFVVFRELAPNLTRVQLSFDLDPGGPLEKLARGARFMKRAARADLHRFAAFVEMLEGETGAWRGVIEDGELVEDHDPSYDKKREYASAEGLVHGRGSGGDDEADEDQGKRSGNGRGTSASRSRSSSGRSAGRSSGGSASRGRSSGSGRSGGSSTKAKSRSGSGRSGSSSGGRSGSSSNGGSGSSSNGGSGSSSGASGRARGGSSGSSRNSSSAHEGRSRPRSSRRS